MNKRNVPLNILSERNYQHWPSYFVVYEWEDVFAENGFNLVLRKGAEKGLESIARRARNKVRRTTHPHFKINGNEYNFVWIIDARLFTQYCDMNTIPIFLDFPVEMLETIKKATKSLPFFWVTCLDIYNKLKELGTSNVYYIPLSISDKYFNGIIPEKSVDVIQFGRKNNVLHEYMLNYCHEHPDIEYVYQSGDGSLTYESTTRGDIGRFDDRQNYFAMMAKSKVSLVSSPGIDSSRDFGGIDFITPRFYESAVNYCYMIGRYTKNEETRLVEIDKVCPCVESYKEFEEILDSCLTKKEFKDKSIFDEFLSHNITSNRAKQVLQTIEIIKS